MDVMRGLEESGGSAPLPGVENLMLHFTPYAEDWSRLPVIVSGEGCYVTDDKGNSYLDGLAGLFTTQVGHGRTMGALSVTGLPSFKAPFEPLLQGFMHVPNTQQDPEGAADAIEEAIEFGPPETVAAVILEPVQNAGGCLVPPPDYWKRVREICDKHGVLLVSDAVICAFGRLGEWFGIERFDVVPDMTSFAKGVTSGYLPMGGVVVNDRIASTLRENAPMFTHGSTFGGHPVSSAVAVENMAIIEREGLLENVHEHEGHFGDELRRMAEDHPIVKEVRGMGFFWAVEVNPEKAGGTPLEGDEYQKYFKGVVSRKLLEGGLICRFDDKDDPVIQFSPALTSDREVLSRIAEITDEALTELEKELGYRN